MSHPPLRAVVVGAGAMGREWIRTAAESPDVELVAVVDTHLRSALVAAEKKTYFTKLLLRNWRINIQKVKWFSGRCSSGTSAIRASIKIEISRAVAVVKNKRKKP